MDPSIKSSPRELVESLLSKEQIRGAHGTLFVWSAADAKWRRKLAGFVDAICASGRVTPDDLVEPVALNDHTLLGTGSGGLLLTRRYLFAVDAPFTGWVRLDSIRAVDVDAAGTREIRIVGGLNVAHASATPPRRNDASLDVPQPSEFKINVRWRDGWFRMLAGLVPAIATGGWDATGESVAFESMPVGQATNCQLCGDRFTWWWTHRHKCARCTAEICAKCGGNDQLTPATVSSLEFVAVEMCDSCVVANREELESSQLDDVIEVHTMARDLGKTDGLNRANNLVAFDELRSVVDQDGRPLLIAAFKKGYAAGYASGTAQRAQQEALRQMQQTQQIVGAIARNNRR